MINFLRLCAAPLLLLITVGIMIGSPLEARAQGSQDQASGEVLAHGRRVEQRALGSSFAELEAFGEAARLRHDEEGLSRLHHVTWIMINQSDFESAERWNAALRQSAQRQNSARYLAVAQVNDLQIAHFRDGDVPLERMEALAAVQTDWLAKAVAQTAVARMLIDERRTADAIRVMAGVVSTIPADQAQVASVAASAWDRVSIAHMMIDDVPGYLQAINRAETYMAASNYPRPDYESLYNLAQSLGFLGRHEEARTLVGIYGRLAARTGTPAARGHAGMLCSYEASASENWPGVLGCLAPFGQDLAGLGTNTNTAMAHRAAAYARTGQVALAERDVAEIERRVADGRMSVGGTVRRARAELLIAQGDYARGVPALREYHLRRFLSASQASAAATEQIVVGIDDQLQGEKEQNALKATVIDIQRWLVVILIVLAVGAAAMFWRQRQLSRQLKDAGHRLQDAFDAKSAFFANMSHEIRTPLNGVVAMADALGRRRLDDDSTNMVRIIASSGVTLERLLSDILDSAKMEAGQIEIEVIPFDLGEAVSEVEALWAHAAQKKGVRVEARVDKAIDHWAMGDRVRLSQVLNNLVSNALKFTSDGRVVLTAEPASGDRVRFMVTDTGVGFDAEQKMKIFERFQQADGSITRRFGGTGLGLSICRQLVELMDGELDCDSTPGEGSRFWFEIPLPAAPVHNLTPTSVSIPNELADMPTLKILIVDDHAANRTILGMLLDDDATELKYVENGREAVEAVRSDAFDVVLMDMEMPVMGGLEATRVIRKMEADTGADRTTVIIFSANSSSEDQKRGRDAGADGHIAKPVVLERLLEGINLALRRSRQLSEAA